jgi:hypothetical protein
LHLLRNLQLLRRAALRLLFLGQGTAFLFKGAGQAVYASEGKRISVEIFEVRVYGAVSIHGLIRKLFVYSW